MKKKKPRRPITEETCHRSRSELSLAQLSERTIRKRRGNGRALEARLEATR